jgi:predicted ATP-grasp superfamily ATP-dependent carboligase
MHTEGLRDLPFPGDLIPAKKPVATAIAAGANREDCLNRLEAISSLMRNQLSQV